jgi:phosphoglycerate dehydrogenase-like enzyme
MSTFNILSNLPPGFYRAKALAPHFKRLAALGTLRKRSWNTPEEISPDLPWADAILMWSWPVLDRSMLDTAKRLRVVGCIDIGRTGAEIYFERNMPVSTARRCWSPAVAEMALTLTLASLRKTSIYHEQMRRGKEPWVKDFPVDVDHQERELTGLSVGIVGLGAVGRRFAQLLAPFKGKILVYDPFLPEEAVATAGGVKVELKELISTCDVVVLCAASNPGTKKLLGGPQIRALKKNAVLVNVARAALVDTPALITRLQKNDLTAAIDVFDQEPLKASHPLRKLPNCLLTPHRAGGLVSSIQRGLTMLIDDIEAQLGDRALSHPLIPAMLPGLDA